MPLPHFYFVSSVPGLYLDAAFRTAFSAFNAYSLQLVIVTYMERNITPLLCCAVHPPSPPHYLCCRHASRRRAYLQQLAAPRLHVLQLFNHVATGWRHEQHADSASIYTMPSCIPVYMPHPPFNQQHTVLLVYAYLHFVPYSKAPTPPMPYLQMPSLALPRGITQHAFRPLPAFSSPPACQRWMLHGVPCISALRMRTYAYYTTF